MSVGTARRSAYATCRKAVQLKAEADLATETKCTATHEFPLVHADETAYLLRSPKNARRLLTALRRANRQTAKLNENMAGPTRSSKL
jgi:hypothetical protein